MDYKILIWTVVAVAVTVLIFGFFLVIRFKLLLNKKVEIISKKVKQLEEVMDSADVMINEINNLSDFVTERIEKANKKLSLSIKEIDEKILKSEEIIKKIGDINAHCKEVIEKYNDINTSFTPIITPQNSGNANKELNIRVNKKPIDKQKLVLDLLKEGKNNRDIAKELSMGQREVELIIGMNKK